MQDCGTKHMRYLFNQQQSCALTPEYAWVEPTPAFTHRDVQTQAPSQCLFSCSHARVYAEYQTYADVFTLKHECAFQVCISVNSHTGGVLAEPCMCVDTHLLIYQCVNRYVLFCSCACMQVMVCAHNCTFMEMLLSVFRWGIVCVYVDTYKGEQVGFNTEEGRLQVFLHNLFLSVHIVMQRKLLSVWSAREIQQNMPYRGRTANRLLTSLSVIYGWTQTRSCFCETKCVCINLWLHTGASACTNMQSFGAGLLEVCL